MAQVRGGRKVRGWRAPFGKHVIFSGILCHPVLNRFDSLVRVRVRVRVRELRELRVRVRIALIA